MKTAAVLILFLVFVFPLFPGQADAAGQPVYLGEVCFFMTSDLLSILPSRLELSILSYGNNRFILDGQVRGDLPPSAFVHGSGEIDGANIVVSLYSTDFFAEDAGTPPQYSFTFYRIMLDAATLSGTYTYTGFGITPPSSAGDPNATARPFIRTGGVGYNPCQ